MSYFAITDAEEDLGIDYAFKRFGVTIARGNLRKVGDHLLMLRQTEQLEFPAALRKALNLFHLDGTRREWYKAALGKMFDSRKRPMRRGTTRLPKKVVPVPSAQIPTIREGDQYAFAAMRQKPQPKERTNGT